MLKPLLLIALALFPMLPASAGSTEDSGPLIANHDIRAKASPKTAADIRVDVNMTLVPVTVLDPAGRNVLGLASENFRILEGSRDMPIASFGRQEAPISVGLIFDCSRSMREKFKTARMAPSELYSRLNPEDESFLVTLSDRAQVREGLTSSFSEIENALIFAHPDGSTSLLDGVYLGLSQLKKAHNPKKALVIVSDGGENNSRYSTREILRIAEESDVQVFAIGLFDNPQSQEERDGPELMSELCGKTGGSGFVISNLQDLRSAFAKIGATLHNQYVLGFYPPQQDQPGKYRDIRVQLLLPPGSPRLQVYARSGYYAPGR